MSVSHQSWKDVPTGSVNVGGTKFVYRQLGPDTGIAVIFLNHLDRQAPAQDSQASGEGRSVPSGLSHLGNPAARAPLNPVPLGMWCNVGGPSASLDRLPPSPLPRVAALSSWGFPPSPCDQHCYLPGGSSLVARVPRFG